MSIELKFGSFEFDEAGGSGENIVISDIDVKESLPIKSVDIPKMDGSVAEEAKRKALTISVQGHLIGANYAATLAKLDTLKAALFTGKQKFTVDSDRFLKAQIQSFQAISSQLNRIHKFKASFLAEYPFWRSETLKTDTKTPTSGVGYNITNSGNAPARVKISLVAPAGGISDDIQIENTTRGETLKFRGDVAAADVLIIDNRVVSDDDFVVTNDGSDAHQYFEGDFLLLSPGVNAIEYTGTAGAAITLSWRDTWF